MPRTTEEEHAQLVAWAEANRCALPPDRPGPFECCDRFCDPCIWDYYERALERWRGRHPEAPSPEPRE